MFLWVKSDVYGGYTRNFNTRDHIGILYNSDTDAAVNEKMHTNSKQKNAEGGGSFFLFYLEQTFSNIGHAFLCELHVFFVNLVLQLCALPFLQM